MESTRLLHGGVVDPVLEGGADARVMWPMTWALDFDSHHSPRVFMEGI